MIEHIKVIPDSYAKDIEQELNTEYFPWYYNLSTVDCEFDYTDKNIVKSSQYTHQIFSTQVQPSYVYHLVKPVLFFVEEKLNIKVKSIDRIKANSLQRIPHYKKNNYAPPHWDNDPRRQSNRLSCVYYVNNSDGDTRLFDKKYPNEGSNLTIVEQFSPKQGYATIFNSDRWHCGSNPIVSERRIVINYVFEVTT
jgi:hypothetical protein